MSYRKKHIRSKIHKIKPKKSIFKKLWFWIIVICLAVILTAVYFFIFFPGVQIKNISISGTQKVLSEDIKNLSSSIIDKKIISIAGFEIESRSIFLTQSKTLDLEIKNKFPAIESVKVKKHFFQTLEIIIAERASIAVFCPSLDKASEDNCYSLDNNGIIFEPLDALPQGKVIVRQTTDIEKTLIGKRAVQQNVMDLILRAEKNLSDNFQIHLEDALIVSPLRMNAGTSEGWKIYFSLSPDSDINSQLTKLNLLLGGEISETQRKNLRYINLIPKDKAEICDNSICGG